MKRFSILVVILLSTSLLLAGCGPQTTKLTVDMVEFAFTPTEFTVPAGGEVELTLINNGTVEHEFVIMKLGQSVSVPFSDDDEDNIYWEHEVESSATETVTFTAPTEPGEYQIVCGIAGHLENGMEWSLTVK